MTELLGRRSGEGILPNPALARVAAGTVYSHVVLKRQLEVISSHARARPPVHADLLVVLCVMSCHTCYVGGERKSASGVRGGGGGIGTKLVPDGAEKSVA